MNTSTPCMLWVGTRRLITLALTLGLLGLLVGAATTGATTLPLPERTYLPLVGRTMHQLASYYVPPNLPESRGRIVLSTPEYGPGRALDLPLVCGSAVRWAPDGAALACATQQCFRGICTFTGLHIVDLDGRHVELPRGTGTFAWSPNGRQLAFLNVIIPEARNTLEAINVDGTGQATLAEVAKAVVTLSWSPDGTAVAYSVARTYRLSDASCPCDLFVVRPGATPTRLAQEVHTFAWSPDSTRLAISRSDNSRRFEAELGAGTRNEAGTSRATTTG